MTEGSPSGSTDLDAVDVRLHRGRADIVAGDVAGARERLVTISTELRRRPDTPPVRRRQARALWLVAMAEFELQGTDTALERLDEAMDSATAADDDELAGLIWSLRATVLGRSGRLRLSLDALDEAARRLDAMPPRDRTIVLMNRGNARGQAGDLTGAVTDLDAASKLAKAHDLALEQFMALHNMGYVHHLLGDPPSALRAMRAADAITVDVARGTSKLDQGRVLLEAGLVLEAAQAFERASELAQADGEGQIEAEATYELARTAMLLGDIERARRGFDEATRRFDERTAGVWVLRCRLAGVRLRLLADSPRAEARAAGSDAVSTDADDLAAVASDLVEAASAGGPALARAAAVLAAEAVAASGDGDGARALLPDDGETLPLMTARLDEHRARVALAVVDGDADGARRALRDAAEDLERASMSASTLDLRTARQAHAVTLAATDLGLALRDGPIAAIAAVDRWRAASSRLPPVRPTASPSTTHLLTRRRQLRERLRDGPPDEDAWQELARVEHEIAAERREAAHVDGPPRADPRRASIDDVLQRLSTDDRDLLVTATHGRDVLAIGVIDGRPTIRRVGDAGEVAAVARRLRADLRMLATRHLGRLQSSVEASLRATAADLAHRLLGEDAIRDRRLLVVAHGDLVALPWGLLVPGRPVVLASSPSAWCRATSSNGSADTHQSSLRIVRGPRLVAAELEATSVAAAWRAEPPDADAQAADLVDAVASADIVHVVAHGQHHRQQPLFSSLALADGPCSLYDLETAGVTARQVVLAACDAGRASVRPGDEPLGLSAGLLALGARSVVAPVTPVPDELLPDVMGRLHTGLAAGVPTDEALVAATAVAPLVATAFTVAGTALRCA